MKIWEFELRYKELFEDFFIDEDEDRTNKAYNHFKFNNKELDKCDLQQLAEFKLFCNKLLYPQFSIEKYIIW